MPHEKDYASYKVIKNIPSQMETDIAKETINAKNILIIDDINTSGSTLREVLRILNEINSNCNIYIYTLIGKN